MKRYILNCAQAGWHKGRRGGKGQRSQQGCASCALYLPTGRCPRSWSQGGGPCARQAPSASRLRLGDRVGSATMNIASRTIDICLSYIYNLGMFVLTWYVHNFGRAQARHVIITCAGSADAMESALDALSGLAADVRIALCADAEALLEARDASTKVLHEKLKEHGVAALGLRAKVAQAIAPLPRESQKALAFRAALTRHEIDAGDRDNLVRKLDVLIGVASSSIRELHDVLRALGIKSLGQRQKVLLALQPNIPVHAPRAGAAVKPPARTQAATAANTNGGGGVGGDNGDDDDNDDDDDDDDALMLEENGNHDGVGGAETADEDSDGLELEVNDATGDAVGGSDDDDDGLMLEENPDGSSIGWMLDGAARSAYAGDMQMALCDPPSVPAMPPPPAVKPTEPVEGALFAGIQGSRELKRSAALMEPDEP